MNSEQAGSDQNVPVKEPGETQGGGEVVDSASRETPDDDGAVVVWTPRFIFMFALTLLLGLTLESLFTQGWWIHWISGLWVFPEHIVLIGICWIYLLVVSHSRWTRLGSLFGIIWTAFMTIDIVLQVVLHQVTGPILALVNLPACLAFLGCYLCLSIEHPPTGHWDAWLLGLSPILGAFLAAVFFFLGSSRTVFGLENSTAAAALALSALIWWARPSCWKAAPGATFLLGVTPILLLILNVTNAGYNATNFFLAHVVLDLPPNFPNRVTLFFFTQVALLCLLLGAMRLAKYESALKRVV